MHTEDQTDNKPTTIRLGAQLRQAMDRLFERDGIAPSEQARRALKAYLAEKGVLVTSKRGAR